MAGGNIPPNLAPIFAAAGRKEHIPPAVLAGVSSVETNLGRNRSRSSAGAIGLMQFMPATARALGINPMDDRAAIFGAAKLLNQYGYQHDPMRALGAYNGGPGNPQYSYAHQVMSEAQRLAGQLHGVAPGATGGGNSGFTVPSVNTTFSGGGTDWQSAGLAALMQGANRRINTSGKVTTDNVLGRLISNATSGQFTNPSVAHSHLVNQAAAQTSAAFGSRPLGHSGYVNPVRGAVIGRTDMGVDASYLQDGHPILAMGNSRVVGISPNWYKGQPYVLFQLLDGPAKGRYYYIAEAIHPTVRPGQRVRAGQVVGRYFRGGTGLELGWGSPVAGRTLAQATTGYHEGQVTPAGLDYRHLLTGLH